MIKTRATLIGSKGEDLALSFLKRQGLELVDRNYRCKRGELDLVMLDGQELVFVEVKYRSGDQLVDALESVGFTKQKRLIRASSSYLDQHPRHWKRVMRFDVVAITAKREEEIEWVQDAFEIDQE